MMTCLSIFTYGQTYTSSTTGSWTVGSTWVGGSAPVLASSQLNNNTIIAVGNTVTLTGNLTVKNGVTLTVRGKLIASAVDFQNGSIVIVESGGILQVSSLTNSNNSTNVTINGSLTISGNFTANTGSALSGSGTMNVSGTTSGTGTSFGQVLMCTNCTAMTGGIVDVIVDGNTQNIDIPIDCGYRYNYSEQIYYRSEINREGNITSLSFEYDGYEVFTEPVKIYLGLTSKTSFSGTNDWVTSNNMTLVYTGNYALSNTAGWYTITFNTPFYYNNVDNLVIGVYEYGYDYHSTSADFLSYSTSPINRVIYFDSDSQNPNPSSPPAADGTWYYVPSLRLKIEDLPVPLPIELLYFKGKQTEEGNLLEWATATENNNQYFTIYKTYYPINWKEVVKVDGVGTSSFTHHYKYLERGYFNDISYYYLSQTDYDGKFKNFNIISIDNRKSIPELVKITNTLGQDVSIDSPGIKFFHYSDGSIVKRF